MAEAQTIGKPPVLVAKDKHCDECGKRHDFERCPKCGAWISFGYGLAGGGMGRYAYCNDDDCDWFWKELEDPEGSDE